MTATNRTGCEQFEGLEESALLVVANAEKLRDWVNGDEQSTVALGGKQTPTIRKLVNDIDERESAAAEYVINQGKIEIEAIRTEAIEATDAAKNEAIETVTVLKTDSIREIGVVRESAVNDTLTLKNETVRDMDLAKHNAIEAVKDLKEQATEDIANLKSGAIETVTIIKNQATEDITNVKTSAIETVANLNEEAIEEITSVKTGAIDAVNAIKEEAATEQGRLNEVIAELTDAETGALAEVDAARTGALGEIETKRADAVSEILEKHGAATAEIESKQGAALGEIESARANANQSVENKKTDCVQQLQNIVDVNIPNPMRVCADIAARDALSGVASGDEVLVLDASGDPQIGKAQSCLYIRLPENQWGVIDSRAALEKITEVNSAIAECQTGIAANKTALEGMANHGERIAASETALEGMANHGERIAASETAIAGMSDHGDRITANETAIAGMADHDERITAAQAKAEEAKTAADNAAQAVDAKADKTYVDEELAKKLDAKSYITRGVVGVAQTAIGVEGRSLTRIDVDGKYVFINPNFYLHPVYASIAEQKVSGQDMIRIPKFFFRRGIAEGGMECLDAWSVSDTALPGYEVHPAFLAKDGETALDQIWIGKYQASDDSGTKLASKPDVSPLSFIDFTTMQTRCIARNTNGVDGFHLWNIHEWAAIGLLMLIEYANTDLLKLIGRGRLNANSNTNVSASDVAQASWRGLVGLWGNIYQMCDGLRNENCTWHVDMGKGYVDTGLSIPDTAAYFNRTIKGKGSNWSVDHLFIGDVVNDAIVNESSENLTAFPNRQNQSSVPLNKIIKVGGCYYYGMGMFTMETENITLCSQYLGGRLAKW